MLPSASRVGSRGPMESSVCCWASAKSPFSKYSRSQPDNKLGRQETEDPNSHEKPSNPSPSQFHHRPGVTILCISAWVRYHPLGGVVLPRRAKEKPLPSHFSARSEAGMASRGEVPLICNRGFLNTLMEAPRQNGVPI